MMTAKKQATTQHQHQNHQLSRTVKRIIIILTDVLICLHQFSVEIVTTIFSGTFGGKCKSNTRLDNKTVIVTGCNTGVGKCVALDLCKRGARVIMACRNPKKAEEAADEIRNKVAKLEKAGEVVIKQLNLASFKSIRECAEDILASEKSIHILVNNAGVFCRRILTEDNHEAMFQINFLGHYLFTMLLLPRLIKSAPARIVNVTSLSYTYGDSEMHFDDITLARSYWTISAYGRSKLAIILSSNVLAKKLQGTGVTVYSAHPGTAKTDIARNLDTALHPITSKFYESRLSKFLQKTPWEGAQTPLHCALDEKLGQETGLFYSDCKARPLLQRAKSVKKAQQLWEFSWDAVGLPKNYNPFVEG